MPLVLSAGPHLGRHRELTIPVQEEVDFVHGVDVRQVRVQIRELVDPEVLPPFGSPPAVAADHIPATEILDRLAVLGQEIVGFLLR